MKKSVVVFLFIIVSLVAIASLGFALYTYNQMQSVKKVATATKPDDDQKMMVTIGSLMLLPDEKPTIVTVTDREKLQDQEFFRKAQNGDRVIIYESIRRIILYRPSAHKVVDIAPLIFNSQGASGSAQKLTPTPVVAKTVVRQDASQSAGTQGVEERGNFRLQP